MSSKKLKLLNAEAIKNVSYVFMHENIAKMKIAKMKISLIIKCH